MLNSVETSRAAALPVLGMDGLRALEPRFDLLSFALAHRFNCAIGSGADGQLRVVAANPWDEILIATVELRIEQPVRWYRGDAQDIKAWLAIEELKLNPLEAAALVSDGEDEALQGGHEIALERVETAENPVVRLVDSSILEALRLDASDIHFESLSGGLVVKYRLDGVLNMAAQADGSNFASQVVSRIKVLAQLDIAERRVPQDGRFRVHARGRAVNLRVSIMPSIHGEDVVLRVLDRRHLVQAGAGLTLDGLGFDPDTLTAVRRLAREPYGMLLVTGPTGSGKTTTLYSALSEINTGQDKIVTIEDPVEYQLPGILQIPVNEKKGLSFARGLRSILRHDPDKILVGEIRDPETAQIAVQAALTGHLVFTTIHANDSFDVIGRLTHMGLDPYSFVSALNGVLAQRLLRLNCMACAAPVEPSPETLHDAGLREATLSDFRFTRGRGCGQCRGTGYHGRAAIGEVMRLGEELRDLIVNRASARSIRVAAERSGLRSLRTSAISLVKEGRTSLEEINRVTLVA